MKGGELGRARVFFWLVGLHVPGLEQSKGTLGTMQITEGYGIMNKFIIEHILWKFPFSCVFFPLLSYSVFPAKGVLSVSLICN